jgi:hypothetical protein
VSGDVLSGNSGGSLFECFLVAGFFFSCEFAFGMGEEVGAVAAQNEHQEQFGIHARRADLARR